MHNRNVIKSGCFLVPTDESGSGVFGYTIAPDGEDKYIVLEWLEGRGSHADVDILVYRWERALRTTVKNATTGSDQNADLAGDASVFDTLNGLVVTADDAILIRIDTAHAYYGSWHPADIGSLGGATPATIDCNTNVSFNGITNIPVASVGNTAYIATPERNIHRFACGSGNVTYQNPMVGDYGCPLTIAMTAGANDREVSGFFTIR